MRTFTPRRSDYQTVSAVHFVSGIHKLQMALKKGQVTVANAWFSTESADPGHSPRVRASRTSLQTAEIQATGNTLTSRYCRKAA